MLSDPNELDAGSVLAIFARWREDGGAKGTGDVCGGVNKKQGLGLSSLCVHVVCTHHRSIIAVPGSARRRAGCAPAALATKADRASCSCCAFVRVAKHCVGILFVVAVSSSLLAVVGCAHGAAGAITAAASVSPGLDPVFEVYADRSEADGAGRAAEPECARSEEHAR